LTTLAQFPKPDAAGSNPISRAIQIREIKEVTYTCKPRQISRWSHLSQFGADSTDF